MEKPFRLGGEIRCLSNLIKRRIDSDPVFSEQNKVTGTHGYILGFLCRKNDANEPVYQRDLEQAFSIRRSTATEVLNTMETNGLILRESSNTDKRLKRLVVTEKGYQTHKLIVSRLNAVDEELINVLTKEEFEALKTALEKLKNNLLEKEAVWQKQ
jgi:DNA-binding MarR family transcriptional regulator